MCGVPVPEPDARRLIATLLADDGDIAQSAAVLITRGVEMQLAAIAVPMREREAILAVLEEPEGRSQSSAALSTATSSSGEYGEWKSQGLGSLDER